MLCYMKKEKGDSMAVVIIILIIVIVAVFVFANSETVKGSKVAGTVGVLKQIEKDIIAPLGHVSSRVGLKLQEGPYNSEVSRVVKSVLIEAVKLNQVTQGELEDIINTVSKFEKEYKIIDSSSLTKGDRTAVERIFRRKLRKYVNSLIEELQEKIKFTKTTSEKEKLKKRIEKL